MSDYYVAKTGDDLDPGTLAEPWLTIGQADSTVAAGDTVHIRVGTYAEQIKPGVTGTSGNVITYQNYLSEAVTLDFATAAQRIVDLLDRAYITVKGFTLECNTTARGIRIENGTHCIIEDCTLQHTSAGSAGITVDDAYTILRNITTIDHGSDGGPDHTDAVIFANSADYSLMEDCNIGNGEHCSFQMRNASYCVIRNNVFDNDWEKACEAAGGYLDQTIRNVWENNTFHAPNIAGDGQDSPGIQNEADESIFRYNIFRHCHGGGFRPEAWNEHKGRVCRDNRIYNNVFYANIDGGAHFALYGVGNNEEISGNQFKNNIFYKNIYNNDSGNPLAITFRNEFSGLGLENNTFSHNDILYLVAGSDVINHANLGTHTLAWYETNHPTEFHDNIEANPQFVDEDNNDFHLLAISPCRNAGTHLTECNGGGTGTDITVDDASWFCDGFNIVDGDDIVVGTDEVTISSINYTTNVITVDESITWVNNDPVYLSYNGSAPDLGAYEYEAEIPPVAVSRTIGVSSYELRFFTAAGIEVARVSDYETLCYTKRVNYPGLCTFTLDGDHAAISLLAHRGQVEVWRSNLKQSIDSHCDWRGFYLSPDRSYTNRNVFTTVCPGQMWLLGTRIVAWYADTANRTKFTSIPAETIMKNLVDYNACANATTGNGRIRNGAITGMSIQADGARGNSLNWHCAWRPLLGELQDLALVAGGDFDLIKTAAQAWSFHWYTGQRGGDRRSTVIFALERGNMVTPRYLHSRQNEKTVAVVGGMSEKDQRETEVRTGDDYSASNDVEIFVDARNRTTAAGLQSAGDKRLDEHMARETFSWAAMQTPACFYGEVASGGDYELGDLITARAFGIEKEHKVVGVTVAYTPAADSCEAIDIEVETP